MWHSLSQKLVSTTHRLVDERTGMINQVLEACVQLDEPELFIFHARCKHPAYHLGVQSRHESNLPDTLATGCGLTREEALWSTLGEAVERYAAECITFFDLESATPNELGKQAIPLEKLILFSSEKYRRLAGYLKPLDFNKTMQWYAGINLHNGNIIRIPAQMLWNDHRQEHQHEAFQRGISTGLACGSNLVHALHTGIREVIERDSFSLYWLTNTALKAIQLDGQVMRFVSPKVRELIEHPYFDVNVRWSTTDIDIPSVVCLVRAKHAEGTAIGSSCHLNAGVALEKAVLEAFHTWNWLTDMKRNDVKTKNEHDIRDFEDHVAYYVDDTHFANLALYYGEELHKIEARHLPPLSGHQNELDAMLARLKAAGFEAYAADITPEDVETVGFHVTKVLVPGLQPLHAGYDQEHDDRRRLDRFAHWIGHPNYQLNTTPHCFP